MHMGDWRDISQILSCRYLQSAYKNCQSPIQVLRYQHAKLHPTSCLEHYWLVTYSRLLQASKNGEPYLPDCSKHSLSSAAYHRYPQPLTNASRQVRLIFQRTKSRMISSSDEMSSLPSPHMCPTNSPQMRPSRSFVKDGFCHVKAHVVSSRMYTCAICGKTMCEECRTTWSGKGARWH